MSETRNGRDGSGRWMPGQSGNPETQFKPGKSGNPKGRGTWKHALAPRTQAKTGAEYNQLASYRPYLKQIGFHAAGKEHGERLLMAGNREGAERMARLKKLEAPTAPAELLEVVSRR